MITGAALTGIQSWHSPEAPPVTGRAPNGGGAKPQLTKLRNAAGEFESILLASLWKSMKESFSDPGDKDSDPTLQSFDEWGIEAMAGAVGSAGGLGIKGLILKHLEPTISTALNAPSLR